VAGLLLEQSRDLFRWFREVRGDRDIGLTCINGAASAVRTINVAISTLTIVALRRDAPPSALLAATCKGYGRGASLYSVILFAVDSRKEAVVKLSARNQLQGTIKEVHKGTTTAHVEIEVGGTVLTASSTNEAVDELKLTKGQKAYAVIKASDVMIGIE
jgi:molybdopterin-binding protein